LGKTTEFAPDRRSALLSRGPGFFRHSFGFRHSAFGIRH
jgi:hypothetical protein